MRIAAYCRVSTDKGEQLESLENQKAFFEDFAKKHKYTLVKIYADEGISGKQMDNRAEFLRMLSDASQNIFDMVVVKDISRFARNTVDFLTAVRSLREMGIEVQFLSNNQTVLGSSEFVLTIFSALAQEESANLSSRVRFGKKVNAKKGRVPNMIYGYDKLDTFTLKINEQEAEVVKKIFDYYTNTGHGSRKIALLLNERKIPSKKGGRWTPKAVRRILSNSIYNGKMVNNIVETVDFLTGKKQPVPSEQNFVHDRPELKIISDEQFGRAKLQLEKRRQLYMNKNPGAGFSNRHTFSTLIKCQHCGYSFSRKVYTYKNTYVRWRCIGNTLYTKSFCPNSFSVDEGELIERIKEYFKKNISEASFVDGIVESYKYLATFQNSIDIAGQTDKLKYLKEKYKMMYYNDVITIDELKEKCREIDGKTAEIKKQAENIKAFLLKHAAIQGEIINSIKDLDLLMSFDEYENADMRKIIERIEVNKNGEIFIHIPLA